MKRARDNIKQQRLSIPLTTTKTSLINNLDGKTSVKSVFGVIQLVYCNSYIKDNNTKWSAPSGAHQVERTRSHQVERTKWSAPSGAHQVERTKLSAPGHTKWSAPS